jgi:hypothetical protein
MPSAPNGLDVEPNAHDDPATPTTILDGRSLAGGMASGPNPAQKARRNSHILRKKPWDI